MPSNVVGVGAKMAPLKPTASTTSPHQNGLPASSFVAGNFPPVGTISGRSSSPGGSTATVWKPTIEKSIVSPTWITGFFG